MGLVKDTLGLQQILELGRAKAFGLPSPPRLPRVELAARVSPMLLSFMSESRRLSNIRMKTELGVRLRWSTVSDLLASLH